MSLRDAERLKDKIEVSLDSRQIFFLFFGGAVVACLVFVLGVMVGRRLETREQVAHKSDSSAAVDPLAALDQLGAEEAARKPSVAGPDKDQADLAFPTALGTAAGRAAAAQEPVAPLPMPSVKPTAVEPRPSVAAEARPAPEKVAEAKDSKKDDEPRKDSKKDSKKKKGKFTLQLSSFQSREEADAFAARLAASGYKTTIVASDIPDKGVWYRVRLGEYPEHEDALAAKTEFEKHERVIAYVTRL